MTEDRVQKYAEIFVDWLVDEGYTHCFFVAGGNIMHLLDAARSRLTCIPFVHEVAAGIATEYFNESDGRGRAFALVTAGPGITNITTAVAGAYLESRELLVVGGQVKSTDLADGGIRQRGIQEIDGMRIVEPITVATLRIERPVTRAEVVDVVREGREGRSGPVFIEFCLDAQGAPVERGAVDSAVADDFGGVRLEADVAARAAIPGVLTMMEEAERPVWLIGGGVSRATAVALADELLDAGVPLMTTWNGADRVGAENDYYFGRPNTWGQRYANVLLQQADLIVAFGTRLGIQQTGFNWQGFAPKARIVQFDLDPTELAKGHPRVDVAVPGDANVALRLLVEQTRHSYDEWLEFCREVKALLPLNESANNARDGYVCPFDFYRSLSEIAVDDDVVIPCSSGGANAVAMQAFVQKRGQLMITDKGLASMGYGLSGGIGASLAHPDRRTFMVEGDGGFTQNLQELATVAVNDLNLKIFVMSNEGYASIRATQRTHMDGHYLGCDTATGLGFPDWRQLFGAYGIPLLELGPGWEDRADVRAALERRGPQGFVMRGDPEQTYYPRITSRVTATGSMESQPLHLMTPDLPEEVAARVLRYI